MTYCVQEFASRVDGYSVDTETDRTMLLVPPRRLGELLTRRRAEMSRSLAEIEQQARGRFSAGDLAMFETGAASPTDEQLRHLAGLYGVDLAAITPQRAVLELDLTECLVSIGDEEERFSPDEDDREILLRYLAIVYRMRAINPGAVVPARNDDLAMLSMVFSTTPSEMRTTLESLMLGERVDLRNRHADLKRRVIVPGLGVLVALTTVGGLLLVRPTSGSRDPVVAPSAQPHTSVSIGTPLVIGRTARDVTPSVHIGTAQVIERTGFKNGLPVTIGTPLVIER